jgi:predicted methyltransferase
MAHLLAIAFAGILTSATAASALAQSVVQQEASDQQIPYLASPGAPASAFPKPDRPVADIISPIWHSEQERDAADEPGQLVRLLGIKPGMTIADIGAGSGYYTVRLSKIVGPNGRIIAQDVQANYLRDLSKRIRELDLKNVTIGLGEPHDPRLPANSIDVAILVHMYHEISQPYGLLYNLVPAMKSGGRIAIVDATARTAEHGTPQELLGCELKAVGYVWIGFHHLRGSSAYLSIFWPPPAEGRPAPATIVACKE